MSDTLLTTSATEPETDHGSETLGDGAETRGHGWGEWQAHWIGPVAHADPTLAPGIGAQATRAPFSRSLYRTEVELSHLPTVAPLRLTADSRYVLLVNGAEVGRGPVRSQPRRMRYDEYDVAEFLRPGVNSVAVLVTYYGAANAFWQPAPSVGGLGVDAALVLEAELGDGRVGDGRAGDRQPVDERPGDERPGARLVTDGTWRVQRSDAWRTFEMKDIDGIPVETVDARLFDADWADVGYDASGWPVAEILAVTHIGGLARSVPPTDPFGALLPRGVGFLEGPVRLPVAETRALVAAPERWADERPAARVQEAVRGGQAGELAGDSIPAGRALSIEADFGRIVAGYVEVDLDAPSGTVVELHYREKVLDPTVPGAATDPASGARYVARGQDDHYRGLEINGLRYLHVVVHAEAEAEVRVTGLRVREATYGWRGEASFSCDDAEITALYEAGRRTVQLNSFDAFTDCPTREQRAWVGDGVVHQLVHLTTNSDWRLARNYVRLGDSPRADHMLPMSVAGDVESSGTTTIPDWTLHWIHGLHNLLRYDGDRELLLEILPTAEKALRWFVPYVDRFGTLSNVPEWTLVDWSSVFSSGRSSILTALWARGLREVAEIARYVGNEGTAAWADGLYQAARIGYDDFWSEERGTYVDHHLDGVAQPAVSQAAGAAAIVSGLAPYERWDRIVRTITDPETLVVRSWIGGADGGYDLSKMAEQARGVQRIDWDASREVVRAEPFFSYVVHDAIAEAGHGSDLVDIMRDWSVFLRDGYDTFGECWGWGTPVHGWSATPTKDLVTHVAGVQPASPGFGSVRIAPRLGALTALDVTAPTPFGPVSLSVRAGRAYVASPVPVTFEHPEGRVQELPAGSHDVAL